jgi:glucose-fructose oxidoreductase
MIRAATAAKVKLMIAYRLHFEAANLEAAQLARDGKLGDLRFFTSDFAMQVSEENIRLRGGKGGGPLYDIGIYCINAARASLGDEPRSVFAAATRSGDRRFREIEENVVATMRFKDERLASFNCSFGAADRATYTVIGTRGSVTVDPAYEYVQAITLRVKIGERERTRQFGKRDQFAAELEYFSQCILDNRMPEPSGAEGLADVRIIEAMHRSIKRGRWVQVKSPVRKQRPTTRQGIRRPPVPSEPNLVDVKAASQ